MKFKYSNKFLAIIGIVLYSLDMGPDLLGINKGIAYYFEALAFFIFIFLIVFIIVASLRLWHTKNIFLIILSGLYIISFAAGFFIDDKAKDVMFVHLFLAIIVIITLFIIKDRKINYNIESTLLMFAGISFIAYTLSAVRLQKRICCDSFAGTKLGSAIDVWIHNLRYPNSECVCSYPGFSVGAVENFYYIPIEYILLGLAVFFIGFRNFRKKD